MGRLKAETQLQYSACEAELIQRYALLSSQLAQSEPSLPS